MALTKWLKLWALEWMKIERLCEDAICFIDFAVGRAVGRDNSGVFYTSDIHNIDSSFHKFLHTSVVLYHINAINGTQKHAGNIVILSSDDYD